MARDYLPVQGSSVPLECVFSQGGLTGTKHRNQLDSETFEAIQILRDMYRTGLISAQSKALLLDLQAAEEVLLRTSEPVAMSYSSLAATT